jgi:cytoskeleton protein RodZ
MSSFGERLRREREMRNISLDEIAATTKVGTRLLRALEDEQFDQLPGGIFNKGYVREYAKYVGIDEERAVADYLQAVNEAASDVHGGAEQNSSSRFDRAVGEESSELQGTTFPIVPVLIVLALVAGVIGGWRIYRERRLDRQSQTERTSTAAPNNAPVSAPASLPDTAPAPSAQAVSGKSVNVPQHRAAEQNAAATTASKSSSNLESGVPFELTVRPKDRAWVSIKSDGQFVVRGIIKPPDVKTIRANSQVVFFTGNAGAVEVSFNGKNVPLTGGANDEQVLVFNSHGVLPGATPQ